MSKEKETEKIINDKLNSREFAFDEKAWAGMETLLDAQEKKRRFGFWWYFSASMFVVLVAGATLFFMPATDKMEKKAGLATATNQRATADNALATVHNSTATAANQTATTDNTLVTVHNSTATTANQLATTPNQLASAANQSVTTANSLAMIDNQSATAANQLATSSSEAVITPIELVATPIVIEAIPNEVATVFTAMGTTPTELIVGPNNENQSDSTKTAEQTLLTETAKNPLTAPGKETKNAWGVMAGVGYWFPYQSTLDATDTKGVIGFTGGIYYQRAFSKHIELGLSAVYSSRGALNYDKTITNSEFGFGIESDKTTIAPQTLHYLNIPLYLRFNITRRSHLLVGASYYQLFATTSKVTRTTENSFGVIESNTEKQTGEHVGFRKNDVAAFIGYELTLFDRMNAGLQFSYGFYDNTLNAYHPDYSGGVDKNISLQLQLKYDLIRH